MDLRQPLTRRAALKDMGKAGLAIMVFGAACTSESANTTLAGVTTTTGGSGPTTTTGNTSSSAPSTSGSEWARVNMGFVSAYILYRNGEAALVDTGLSDAEGDIEAALSSIGLGWGSVTSVVVTHKHPDHAGSVDAVAALATNSNVYAGAGDLSAIGPIESAQGTQGPVPVGDKDVVFGLEIIETPGHTPGHISVYDPVAGILTAGDAINTRSGSLASASADPQFTEDLAGADESVRKLAGFEYEVVLVGHGEPILSGGTAEVTALANTLPG